MRRKTALLAAAALLCGGLVLWILGGPREPAPHGSPQTATRGFHGVIKDARGKPLAARVEAQWIAADADPAVAGSAETGADGVYRLALGAPLTGEGVLVLAASAPAHERAGRRVDPAVARQDFVLAPSPTRVTVAVKNGAGAPVRGAQVTLAVEPEAGEPNALLVLTAATQVGGAAVLEGIPSAAATLHWSVRAPGHAPASGDKAKPWGSAPVLIEVTLQPGATIHGTVVEADGHGVAGALVLVGEDSGPWSAKATTDGTGAFVVRDAPRGRPLVAQLDDADHVLRGGEEEQHFSIPAEADSYQLRLEAQPGGRIAGTVQTSTGRAIEHSVVDAVSTDGRMARRKTGASDAEGRFRITGLRVDTEWRLEARHADFAPGFVDGVRPSRSGGDLRISLVTGGSVSGSVRSDEGGLEGVEAYAHRVARSAQVTTGLREYASERTGSDGRFHIQHLNPGTYRVEVRSPGRMAWSSIAAKVFEVEVREGETAWVDPVTVARPGALRATFTAGSADPGDPFVQLSFMQAGAKGAPHQFTVQRGASGLAVIEGLEPGRYDVTARLEQQGLVSLSDVVIRPARTTDVRFDFSERPGVSGRVERPDRTPVAAAKVDVYSEGAGSQGRYSLPGRTADNFSGNHALTNQEGAFRVAGVEPGAYVVRITAPGEAPAERRLKVGSAGAIANFVLDPPAVAEVEVLDARGKPLASKVVVLEAEQGRAFAGYSESVVTDDRGVAVFRGLPAGAHVVRVVAGSPQPRLSFDTSPGKTSRVTVTVPEAQAAR